MVGFTWEKAENTGHRVDAHRTLVPTEYTCRIQSKHKPTAAE